MNSALEGVKVLDLTRLLPGGFCTLLLADFGADVLKVEDPNGGDYIRWMPPYYGGDEERANGTASAYFALNALSCCSTLAKVCPSSFLILAGSAAPNAASASLSPVGTTMPVTPSTFTQGTPVASRVLITGLARAMR